MKRLLLLIAVLCAAGLAAAIAVRAPQQGPLVLAASSLQEGMEDAAGAWAAKGHPKPVLSFAASSALARQVDAGAPADLFVSADEKWMDEAARNGRIRPETRAEFLGNSLVLIAPAASKIGLTPGPGFPLAAALGSSHLAMADPDSVPAGTYGKTALTALGVWPAIEPRVVRTENVRGALALVERGEAALGVVYATDAQASAKVRVAGAFPSASHPPITYPIARLAASTNPDAEPFRRFLLSPEGKAIFLRHGFTTL